MVRECGEKLLENSGPYLHSVYSCSLRSTVSHLLCNQQRNKIYNCSSILINAKIITCMQIQATCFLHTIK